MSKWTPPPEYWSSRGLPEPDPEWRFMENRKFRFDFAWLDKKIAVEVNGGIFFGGRHSGGTGQIRDMRKLNEAQRIGWRVFQFTPRQLQTNNMDVEGKKIRKKNPKLSETTTEFLRSVLL